MKETKNYNINEAFDTYPVELSDKFNGTFLIDGYALVKYVYETKEHDYQYGGQYVQLIGKVDHMLNLFEKIYLSYRVFFLREFLDCGSIGEEREEFRFLMNVIVMYLRERDGEKVDFVGVGEFYEYLQEAFYSFVLVSNDVRYSVSYQIMKCAFCVQAYCVTIEDIEEKNNTVYSFLMKDDGDVDDRFDMEIKNLKQFSGVHLNESSVCVDDVLKVISHGNKSLTKIFVAHEIVSMNIALVHHAFSMPKEDFSCALMYLNLFKEEFNRDFNPESAVVMDILDVIFIIQGRLFCKCFSMIYSDDLILDILGFNDEMKEIFVTRCSYIFSEEIILPKRFSIPLNEISSNSEREEPKSEDYLTHLHSEFLAFILEDDTYLSPVKVNMEETVLDVHDYKWYSKNQFLKKKWKPKDSHWKTKLNQSMAVKLELLGSSLIDSGELVKMIIEKGGKSSKEVKKSRTVQKIIDDNNTNKKEEERRKLDILFENYRSQEFPPEFILRLDELSKIKFPDMKILYQLKFIAYVKEYKNDEQIIVGTLLKILLDLGLYENQEPSSTSLKIHVVRFWYDLGFCDLASELINHWDIRDTWNQMKMRGNIEIRLDMKITSEISHLMVNYGEHLQRDVTPVEDNRVFFTPDEWQHDLLNVVDNRNSALVVAPTSSGKTFVSYYVMQKILEQNDEDIVVFVSPTKSLVNQVSAEVHTRFNKNLPSGKHILGISTRDYSFHPRKCQILVTVPESFEILLMSPSNEEWKKKIKYVIFDEIHTIKEKGQGKAIERLLLLINCPFLALSATVGEPETFHKWLTELVEFKNFQTGKNESVILISHLKRFSDIRKYYHEYSFSKEVNEFSKEHPYHCLTSELLKKNGYPSTLTMEPIDCIHLYNAMFASVDMDEFLEDISRLDPDNFFTSTLVNRKAVREYEKELKSTLLSWNESSPQIVETVLSSFKHDIYEHSVIDQDFLIHLVNKLEETKKFPALIFHFSRKNIKEFVVLLLQYFEQNSGPPKEIVDMISVYDEDTEEVHEEIRRHFQDMDFDYSYLNEGEYGEMKKILEKYTKKVKDSYLSKSNPVFRALYRGIGMHHGGLRKGYRELVEILFRKKLLKVVFATGTLAYGINMPCRSVVLLGDSTFLGPMNFHQMSGRSGRRGYDLLGEVIFSCIPFNKQKFLMNSSIPPITSATPFSISILLRCLLLVHFTNEKSLTFNNLQRLFQCSQYGYKNPNYNNILKLLFRFSVEYLKNEEIINENCEPLKPALYLSHIFYTEPGNLLLHSILKSNVLESKLIYDNAGNMRVLLKIFARIFCKVHLPKHFVKRRDSPHKIILSDFDEDIIDVVKSHETRAMKLFQEFAKATNNIVLDIPQCGISEYLPKDNSLVDSPLRFELDRCPKLYRNPFAAVSKPDDTYSDAKEFIETSRTDIIDKSYFPATPSKERLNAYIIDFYYSTQNLRTLEMYNHIPSGKSYELINTFSMILQTVYAYLEYTYPDSITTRTLGNLSTDFNNHLKKALTIQN